MFIMFQLTIVENDGFVKNYLLITRFVKNYFAEQSRKHVKIMIPTAV